MSISLLVFCCATAKTREGKDEAVGPGRAVSSFSTKQGASQPFLLLVESDRFSRSSFAEREKTSGIRKAAIQFFLQIKVFSKAILPSFRAIFPSGPASTGVFRVADHFRRKKEKYIIFIYYFNILCVHIISLKSS